MKAVSEAVAADAAMRRARASYYQQKSGAKRRGIAWEFDFDGWLKVWVESGRLDQRGHAKGKFCMARNGDAGPYSKENVRIARIEDNLAEANCREARNKRKQTSPNNA